MAPGFSGYDLERVFNVYCQIKCVLAGHVGIVHRQDHRHFSRYRTGFVLRVFWRERVRNIDHVGDFSNRFRDGNVVNVNARERVGRPCRRKDVIRFEFPNMFPESGEKLGCDKEARFTRDFSIRVAKHLKFELANARRGLLLLDAQLHRFVARAEVVAGLAVGADRHSGSQIGSKFPPPKFEKPGCGEFKVVTMSVERKDLHLAGLCNKRAG